MKYLVTICALAFLTQAASACDPATAAAFNQAAFAAAPVPTCSSALVQHTITTQTFSTPMMVSAPAFLSAPMSMGYSGFHQRSFAAAPSFNTFAMAPSFNTFAAGGVGGVGGVGGNLIINQNGRRRNRIDGGGLNAAAFAAANGANVTINQNGRRRNVLR